MNALTSPVDIRPDHLEIVCDILSAHLPTGFKVWVFGSRATWTTKDSSDLDLAVEGATRLGHKAMGGLEIAFEESDLPYAVDVVDLNAVGDSFRKIVESQRVALPLARDGTEWKAWVAGAKSGKGTVGFKAPLTLTSDRWREVTFGECAELIRDSVSPSDMGDTLYIGLEHIGESTLSLLGQGTAADVGSMKSQFQRGDILFGKLRPYFRKVVRAPADGLCSTDIWVVRARDGVDQGYLYYCMASQQFVDFATAGSEGTKMPRAVWDYVSRYRMLLPPLPEQRPTAHVLETLDDKIELNRHMNETLEEMARALFRSWFVDFDPVRAKMEGRWRSGESLPGLPADLYDLFPGRLVPSELGEIPEGWDVKPLDSIATFLNGLALQKYPANGGAALPVIKIAQLRAGHTRGADLASQDLPQEYRVYDGDMLFSWSGSLELDIWPGGNGALNQHLFKVSSEKYPKWLYYWWIGEHLPDFREIAADKATTMGHIQRHHLTEALTLVPGEALLTAMTRHMQPLLDLSLRLRLASRMLAEQRDALLPRLVNGEVRIPRLLEGSGTTN
ncbi:MAG: restriction endonuclease subunit S [Chloroflexi bacterium]|nr:restriction endonuclease subunit S [Chloroflexota bacterium]MYK33560.1 restriction endonuclease subunit S [Chloroflexota bacterium]